MGTKWNGGMGPQTVITRLEADMQMRDDEKSLLGEFRGGIEFGCPRCGEAYKIGNEAEVEDVRLLQGWLANGNCPYCKDGTMAMFARLRKAKMVFSNIPHNFKIETPEEEIEFYCIRLGKK